MTDEPQTVEEIAQRLLLAHQHVAMWPEKRMRPDAVLDLGPGFIDLLALRNLVPEAAAHLIRLYTEAEQMRLHLQTANRRIEAFSAATAEAAERVRVAEEQNARLAAEIVRLRAESSSLTRSATI